MRIVVVILSAALLIGCGASRSVDSTALESSSGAMSKTIDFDKTDTDTLVTAIEMLTNQVREQQGVAPLETHRALRKAAQLYAKKMVKEGFLAHEDPNTPRLRSPQQRVVAAGGQNAITAENIADVPAFRVESGEPFYVIDAKHFVISRQPDGPPIEAHTYASFGAVVVEGWMNSAGHRRNLLAPDALEQGIGAQMYLQNGLPAFVVVQVFQLREALR